MEINTKWVEVKRQTLKGIPIAVNIDAAMGENLLFLFGDGTTCIVTRIFGGFKDNLGNKYTGGSPIYYCVIPLPEKETKEEDTIKDFCVKLCDLVREHFNKK